MTDGPLALERRYCAHNYEPLPVVLTRGEGVHVWDDTGRRYLDMLGAYSAMSHGHAHPRRVAALAGLGLGFVLVVAPVTLRNTVVGGDFVLITSQAGQNFFIGNYRGAMGLYRAPPFVRAHPFFEEEDFRAEARRRTGRRRARDRGRAPVARARCAAAPLRPPSAGSSPESPPGGASPFSSTASGRAAKPSRATPRRSTP